MSDLLTIPEAAQRLRVSPSTVRREIADGRLVATKIRQRRTLVSCAALAAYIEANQCQSAPAQEAAGKSVSGQAMADALNKLSRQVLLAGTPSDSKPSSLRGKSRFRQARSRAV